MTPWYETLFANFARAYDEESFTQGTVGEVGRSQTVETNERYYTPSEMRWLLRTAGFAGVDIFGCHLGQFSRQHPLTVDDFEMLVVAEKAKTRPH